LALLLSFRPSALSFLSLRYRSTFLKMSDVEKHPVTICIHIGDDSSLDPLRGVYIGPPPTVLDVPPDTNHSHKFPEGGLKAHLTVLGAFIALACTFGQLSAFGTFQAWYASHQLRHMPASTISWIGSLQLWIFFFTVRF